MKTKIHLLIHKEFSSLNRSQQEEVYRDFYKLVYYTVIKITHDHATTEDIVQEAFIRTIYNAPAIDNEQQLIGWIRVVSKNLTLNVLKKHKKISNQDDIESVINNRSMDESIESQVEVRLLENTISQSVSQLNSEYQNVIKTKWIEGKTNKQIAKEFNSTENAIKQKLYRARKALKEKMSR